MEHLIRPKIEKAIQEERTRQDALWGGPPHDDLHTEQDWVVILARQLGLATMPTAIDGLYHLEDIDRWERQMTRLAAVAIAALEAHYRNHPERLERPITLKTDPGY